METENLTERLVRTLDIIGMGITPISFSLPLFLLGIQSYHTSNTNSNDYTGAILWFFVAFVFLIGLGLIFGKGLKSYVYYQVTRDDIMAIRMLYSGFILGSLILYILFFF